MNKSINRPIHSLKNIFQELTIETKYIPVISGNNLREIMSFKKKILINNSSFLNTKKFLIIKESIDCFLNETIR